MEQSITIKWSELNDDKMMGIHNIQKKLPVGGIKANIIFQNSVRKCIMQSPQLGDGSSSSSPRFSLSSPKKKHFIGLFTYYSSMFEICASTQLNLCLTLLTLLFFSISFIHDNVSSKFYRSNMFSQLSENKNEKKRFNSTTYWLCLQWLIVHSKFKFNLSVLFSSFIIIHLKFGKLPRKSNIFRKIVFNSMASQHCMTVCMYVGQS